MGSAVYLVLIFGAMLWRGISIEPEWVVLALLLIAIALGRGRSFVIDWLPFLILFLAYEEMRGFAAKTGFAPYDLSGMERFVFGGSIPTLVLQHAFYHPGVVSPQDVIAIQTVSALWDGQYAVSQIYNSFNPNRFAAFPSLHAAFPALAAAYAWSRYRPLAIGLIAWSAAVLLSIVYLGEHYVVDALDGYLYVAVALAIVELVARWRAKRAPRPATPSA